MIFNEGVAKRWKTKLFHEMSIKFENISWTVYLEWPSGHRCSPKNLSETLGFSILRLIWVPGRFLDSSEAPSGSRAGPWKSRGGPWRAKVSFLTVFFATQNRCFLMRGCRQTLKTSSISWDVYRVRKYIVDCLPRMTIWAPMFAEQPIKNNRFLKTARKRVFPQKGPKH